MNTLFTTQVLRLPLFPGNTFFPSESYDECGGLPRLRNPGHIKVLVAYLKVE